MQEIERKYLLTGLPDVYFDKEYLIQQGYIKDVRLRKRTDGSNTEYFICLKLKTNKPEIRQEYEYKIPSILFNLLWPLTYGKRIIKTRGCFNNSQNKTWEVDRFLDRDLFLAEIELENADEYALIPDCLYKVIAKEVTGESKYLNINLAK